MRNWRKTWISCALIAMIFGAAWLAAGEMVEAGWGPPRLNLNFGSFTVAGGASASPSPSPAPPPLTYSTEITVPSSEPDCSSRSLALEWVDPELQITFDKEKESGKILFQNSNSTLALRLKPVPDSCSQLWQLLIQNPENRTALPWGSTQTDQASLLAHGSEHRVPQAAEAAFHTSWYVPPNGLELEFLATTWTATPSPLPQAPQPLLGTWWKSEPGSLSDSQTDQTYQDCHTAASLFWPKAEQLCQSTDPLYQVGRNRIYANASSPTAARPLPEPGQVLMSEVNWAGSFRGSTNLSDDEWIEFSNTTPESLQLNGLQIEGARTSGGTLVISSNLLLPPYGQVIVGKSSGEDTQLAHIPDWVTSSLTLSNTQANLILRHPDGRELDRTPPGAWQDGKNQTTPPQRASAQRRTKYLLQPNNWLYWYTCPKDDLTGWCTALNSINLKPSTTDTWANPWVASPW